MKLAEAMTKIQNEEPPASECLEILRSVEICPHNTGDGCSIVDTCHNERADPFYDEVRNTPF